MQTNETNDLDNRDESTEQNDPKNLMNAQKIEEEPEDWNFDWNNENKPDDQTDRQLAQDLVNMSRGIDEIKKRTQVAVDRAQRYLSVTRDRQSLDELLKENAFVCPTKLPSAKIPAFLPIQARPVGARLVSTRFITFINLKGGVGKTTLSANLAAAFASGNYKLPSGETGRPLNVLAVDLDFQGTLSQRCLSKGSYSDALNKQWTSSSLLRFPGKDPSRFDLPAFPFVNQPKRAMVIPADENLDNADYHHQTLLTLNKKETRFYYRFWFHNELFFKKFDLVVFDCPPRLTASSICALTASDYAFMPCAPDYFDISAVNRTVNWIGTLQKNLDLRLRIAGIILNRTNKATSLSQNEKARKEKLETMIKEAYERFPQCDTGIRPYILDHFIPRRSGENNSINGAAGEPLPGETQDIFGGLASEIHRRIY